MAKSKSQQSGLTLVETLIYIAIVGMVVTSIVSFSLAISNTRTKTYVVQEVQANTRVALEVISQRIRMADSVDIASSTFGVDPGVLVLRMSDGAIDPTVIDLDADDGFLRIKEGADDPLFLTSKQVVLDNLLFTDLTASSSRENIRIEMTASFNNPDLSVEYNYTQNVQTDVMVRN